MKMEGIWALGWVLKLIGGVGMTILALIIVTKILLDTGVISR